MKFRIGVGLAVLVLVGRVLAEPLPKLILLTQSKGFQHDVVKHKPDEQSVVQKTFASIAGSSKLFELETTEDASILTAEKLKQTRIVVFYTTGELPLDFKVFEQWIKDGGGFLATHTGTDTLHENPDYIKLIGAQFDGHPWTSKTKVTLKLNDPANPIVSMFDPHYELAEEIYHYKNFDPAAVRVLMSLDMERTELKKPEHVPVIWCRTYGKGKVLHTELGHNQKVWESDVYQKHLTTGIEWLLRKVEADATPNPDVSKQEEEIAKKAAGEAAPTPQAAATPEPAAKKPAAKPDSDPKIIDGFVMTPFVEAPNIKSPAGLAVTPDGKVFVGEDEYNTQDDRKIGLGHIKLCVDTDGDGKADKITTFADQINSPQGMCYASGTLYVSHAPFLSAFRDTNSDGVADVRDDLVSGFGPDPEDLVHHVPSGVHMGIDGWLYVAIGDKGIKEATGKDGRKITLHGGGVVRVRPDGTELQVFCSGTRNIFDVAIDPYLNTFTRDNTNDGDGWMSRLTKMQRDAVYGYPNLYRHFGDEIIAPMADYGSGGATGSIYIQEPNLPGNFGNCLYTIDWARAKIYRHELQPDGASFYPNQVEFIRDIRATHLDVDGTSRLYCSDWARRNWSPSPALGVIYTIRPGSPPTTAPSTAPALAAAEPWPDLHAMNATDLVNQLAHASSVRRREAQQELLRRGDSAEVDRLLKAAIVNKQTPLYGRVAQLFTLAQLMGASSHDAIAGWVADGDLREFALRALVDRDPQIQNVDPHLFAAALNDPNPRVRVQAAIGLGRLRDPGFNTQLVPLTADKDWFVRHAAQQALRQLGGTDACVAAVQSTQDPKLIAGALRVLRSEHDHKTIVLLENLLRHDQRAIVHREAIRALARLYQVEASWDGKWWDTRPYSVGPNYQGARWEETPAVAQMMIALASDADPETAKQAVVAIGICRMSEAVPMLMQLVSTDNPLRNDAASALIDIKSPESIAALEGIVTDDKFDPDLRTKAATSIGGLENNAALASVIRMIAKLDSAEQQSPKVLEKLTDALAARACAAQHVNDLAEITLHGKQRTTRIVAAQSMLKSDDKEVQNRVAKLWQSSSGIELDGMLAAAWRVPADRVKAYQAKIEELTKAKEDDVRHSAMMALGHLGDAASVPVLMALTTTQADKLAAACGLSEISPDKASDDQVLPIAKLLVAAGPFLVRSTIPEYRDAYNKVLSAAEKFAADKRVPQAEAAKLLVSLKRHGVIYSWMRTDPIPAANGKKSYAFVCPPEEKPNGPFEKFTVGDKTYDWSSFDITDPQGIGELTMPDQTIVYLTAKVDVPSKCTGYLTTGSDDGLKVWLNGKRVLTKEKDRAAKADADHTRVQLEAGPNVLLLKVNNSAGPAGIQARLRWRPTEFEPDELISAIQPMPTHAERGKELFTSLSCVKCHTRESGEEPKGPYLGDVGGKFDRNYIVESILRPNAKIAQGFSTTRVIATEANSKSTNEFIGFITRESGDEIQMRDLTGKVMTISKARITKRDTLQGSMMPEGLADACTLDDFRSLLAYLQSLKSDK